MADGEEDTVDRVKNMVNEKHQMVNAELEMVNAELEMVERCFYANFHWCDMLTTITHLAWRRNHFICHLNRYIVTSPTTNMSSDPKKVRSQTQGNTHSSNRGNGGRNLSRKFEGAQSTFRSKFSSLTSRKNWKEELAKLNSLTTDERRQLYSCKGRYIEYNNHNFPVTSPGTEKICVWQGDITLLEFDAIVNAANSGLRGGGGVDGAIHRGAGSCLIQETRERYPKGCETGHAVITSGYHLPAKYVIHTVGPMHTSPEKLRKCYESVLALVEEENIKTVAFPCISTGIYGYPNDEAAAVALATTKKWLEKRPYFDGRIVFCVYLDKDLEIYQDLASKFFACETASSVGSSSKPLPSQGASVGHLDHPPTSLEKSKLPQRYRDRHDDDLDRKTAGPESMDSSGYSQPASQRTEPDGASGPGVAL